MKKTLFILSALLAWGCSQKNSKNEESEKHHESVFFSSDSTILWDISISSSAEEIDSIARSKSFQLTDECWSNKRFSICHLTNNAFKIILKKKEDVERVKSKMESMFYFSQSENFWFSIHLKGNQPDYEMFLVKKNDIWELKVFPRYRL